MLTLSHNTVSLNNSKIKKKMTIYSLRLKKKYVSFNFTHKKNQQINIKLNNRSYVKTDIYRSKKNLFKKKFQLKYISWNNRPFKRSDTTLLLQTFILSCQENQVVMLQIAS